MLFLVFLYVVYHVNVHTYGYSSFSAVCRGISTYGLTMPAVAFLRNRGNGLIHYLRALDALTLSHSLVAMRPPSFHSFRNDGGDNLLFKSLVSMASLLSSPPPPVSSPHFVLHVEHMSIIHLHPVGLRPRCRCRCRSRSRSRCGGGGGGGGGGGRCKLLINTRR